MSHGDISRATKIYYRVGLFDTLGGDQRLFHLLLHLLLRLITVSEFGVEKVEDGEVVWMDEEAEVCSNVYCQFQKKLIIIPLLRDKIVVEDMYIVYYVSVMGTFVVFCTHLSSFVGKASVSSFRNF